MATTFKYAEQTDLKNYFNNFGDYDQKTQIFPSSSLSDLHSFLDVGYVTMLFVNGVEQAARM